MNDLRNEIHRSLVPFYTYNPGKDDSYTLYIDSRTNTIFKADAKNISSAKVTFLIILGYPIIELFPVTIIPLDNIIQFISVCVIVMSLSVFLGYYISPRMLENYRRVTLSSEEWKRCLETFNQFYFRQFILPSLLLLITIVCFVFLYIFPSSWWFFGGIISGIMAGAGLTSFSKTKYLLYKNKLDINWNNGGEEDEDITYW